MRALKGLRGTPFDIFGYSEERRLERRLIVEYADRMRGLLSRLSAVNYDVAVEKCDQCSLMVAIDVSRSALASASNLAR